MRNLSYENRFDLHEKESLGGTHFHMNGFARRRFAAEAKASIDLSAMGFTT